MSEDVLRWGDFVECKTNPSRTKIVSVRGFLVNVAERYVTTKVSTNVANQNSIKPLPWSEDVLKSATEALLPASMQISGYSGTDPEIFAADADGQIIPAWKYLPDKEHKYIYGTGYSYWDGYQGEISLNQPISCHEVLTSAVAQGLYSINTQLKLKFPKAHLVAQDTIKVSGLELANEAEEHVNLGCAPSENAYGIAPLEVNPRSLTHRFSGAHLHFSTLNVTPKTAPKWFPHGTAVMMDKIGGVILTALGRGLEDPIRRKYYGRPGEFRVPPSTNVLRLEYRTPGSFILRHPAAFIFAADVCRRAFKMGLLMDGRVLNQIPDVSQIIMNCDADAAWKVIEENKAFYTNVLSYVYTGMSRLTTTFGILKTGIAKYIDGDIYQTWQFARRAQGYSLENYRWRDFTSAFN